MKIQIKTLWLVMGMWVVFNPTVFAQKGLGNSAGIARDNLQTEIKTIEGMLDHIKTGPCEHATGYAYIGTHLFIQTEESDQLLNVHLGAAYAVESFVNGLEAGQQVTIQGFQTDEMESNEFIAKEITAGGNILQIRDENLRPFWAGGQNFQRSRYYGRHGCRW